MQSAADDTGLPMLVVRAPFNLCGSVCAGALEKVGMKVTDSTRSQGSMALTYKPLSDSSWQELGARDPQLVSGDYKLQVGDLDNRSSLQFIDPKGHTLTQSQNDRPGSRIPGRIYTSNQKGWSNPAPLIYSDANVCVYIIILQIASLVGRLRSPQSLTFVSSWDSLSCRLDAL